MALDDEDDTADIAVPDREDEDEAAPSKDTDALLRRIKRWYKADKEHWATWRTPAKEDREFVAGHQWSREDAALLKDELRPEITFNRIGPTVDSIVGLEIGNRREVRYIPREQGDVKKNEVLSAVGDWARDECEAEDEESDAFWDCVVTGIGVVETRWSYDRDPDGMVSVDRVDPLEMLFDKDARKRNLVDARRMMRVRVLNKYEARDLMSEYGEFEDFELNAKWAALDRDEAEHSADRKDSYQPWNEAEGEDADDKDMVTLVHVQWFEKVPVYKVALNPDKPETVDAETFARLKKRVPGIKSVKLMQRKYKQAWVGSRVLYTDDAPCPDHFSWQVMTGKRDAAEGTWYGIVRPMKDPQRWANKWLSQSLHILNTNAKGGVFVEDGVFDDEEDAEASYSRSDKMTVVTAGALAGPNGPRIMPKPSPTMPAGFSDLMQFAVSSIRDVSGVNLELLGLKDMEQAGVLEEQRKQAGMTILATIFDALRRYRKRQGEIMLYFITNYLGDGRLVRIMGEGSEQYIPFFHEPGSERYDVIVDDAPNSPNQKEKTWNIIMALAPMLADKLAPEDWLTLAEYSPLPSSVLDKLKGSIDERKKQNAPQEQKKLMLLEEDAKSKIESQYADAKHKLAQAQKAEAEAYSKLVGGPGEGDSTDPRIAQAQVFYEVAKANKMAAEAAVAQAEAAMLGADAVHLEVAPEEPDAAPAIGPESAPPAMSAPSGQPGGAVPSPPSLPAPSPQAPQPAPSAPDPMLAQAVQALMQGQAQLMQAMASPKPIEQATLQALQAMTEQIAALKAPKRVVRDEDGRATHIDRGGELTPIERDENDRIIGGF